MASKRLKNAHPDEYAKLVLLVEADLYPQVIDAFDKKYPAAKRTSQ